MRKSCSFANVADEGTAGTAVVTVSGGGTFIDAHPAARKASAETERRKKGAMKPERLGCRFGGRSSANRRGQKRCFGIPVGFDDPFELIRIHIDLFFGHGDTLLF